MDVERYLDLVQRNERENQFCKMHRCWARFTLKVLFVTWCILSTAPGVSLGCIGKDYTLGIFPEGDHEVEYGSTLELFCKLNETLPRSQGFNATDLRFYRILDGEFVNLPNLTIVNETTIKYDGGPQVYSTYYYCSLGDIKCLTFVTVGYKPQPVLDFQCVSYNWENLQCNWTPPANPIKPQYHLTYTANNSVKKINCPSQLDVTNNSCLYNINTLSYRQSHEFYTFELLGENVLGKNLQRIPFHHFAHVIPNKPENVAIVNKTVGSAVVGWMVPYPVYNFPPGLKIKIKYKNEWEDWVEVDVPKGYKIQGVNHSYNITGLKYSHTAYDVRIYLKSFSAENGSNGWSEPASVTFVTPSTIPNQPPSTTQGCFEIISSGNDTEVFIYWARILKKFENGDSFTYNVICTRDDGTDCGPPIDKAASFAKFPISDLHSYTFTIYSINEVGRSLNSSYVFVPKYDSSIHPQSLTKVAYDVGVFELSWKPVHHPELSNYTIFWCKEEMDLPVPCKGYLDWLIVPKDNTAKNITMNDVTKFYKFAIAANLADGTSSGMVWSSCVISHDKVLKKVDDFNIWRTRSREVDVVWEIRCAQSSAIIGFEFYYCPVVYNYLSEENKCMENTTEQVMKLNVSKARNITLYNLKPVTTYKLQIAIISLGGSQQIQLGPRSAPKRFTTLEDAPTVPLNLSAVSVTNNSVTLMWDLPEEINGVLQKYKLNIGYPGYEKDISFDARSLPDSKNINQYEIKDLLSFTTYNFSLKACTSVDDVKCSDYSEPVVTTTLIGVPGKMMRPQISIVNSSVADISWDVPALKAGLLNYYQLLMSVNSESNDIEIFNLTGSRANLAIKACQVKYNTLKFRIRAINVDKNNVTYFGPWSEATKVQCGSSAWAEKSVLIVWISGMFTFLIISACLIYIIKKGWLQCRKMKDVEVKLPSGLQCQDLEKENQDCVHLEIWPRSTDIVNGSVGTALAPDEESLLDKKSDESTDVTSLIMPIKNGGDSSGCSVGRESVSSSITSDTHISSDSGAEPDQSVVKPPTFELWDSSKPVKINLNDNINLMDSLNFQNIGEWGPNEPALPAYTKVGFGTDCFNQDKNLPGKGYVTIASVAPLNPSQKTNQTNGFTGDGLPSHTKEQFPSDQETKHVNSVKQSNGPKYVSLANFEGQKLGGSHKIHNGTSRSAGKELPKLSRLDESSERDDEKTEDSTEEDFSGKETDTETIHEVPITKTLSPMPPYVSMTDNPSRTSVINMEDEEDENEEEDDETDREDVRLSPEPNDLGNKVNGIDNSVENKNKEKESFSNYIPHRFFEKESVNT